MALARPSFLQVRSQKSTRRRAYNNCHLKRRQAQPMSVPSGVVWLPPGQETLAATNTTRRGVIGACSPTWSHAIHRISFEQMVVAAQVSQAPALQATAGTVAPALHQSSGLKDATRYANCGRSKRPWSGGASGAVNGPHSGANTAGAAGERGVRPVIARPWPLSSCSGGWDVQKRTRSARPCRLVCERSGANHPAQYPRSCHLHQPLRLGFQRPDHRGHLAVLIRAQPVRRIGLADTLLPLGRSCAGRQPAMHSASPVRHRQPSAGGILPGPGAAARWLPYLRRRGRLDVADDRLAAFVDHDPLDPDHLRTLPRFRSRASSMSVIARAKFAPSRRSLLAISGC
jgi:hypothetical protein